MEFIGEGSELVCRSCKEAGGYCRLSAKGNLQDVRWIGLDQYSGVSLLVTNFHEVFTVWGMRLAVTLMVIIYHVAIIGELFFSKEVWI